MATSSSATTSDPSCSWRTLRAASGRRRASPGTRGGSSSTCRAVIDITPDLPAPRVLEQCDYLPFGTKILNPSHASMQANRWRYAGKEEQDFGSLNLGLLDFGARMYDPFTARWTAVDPMASAYYPTTPYSYCASNPISIQDPEGKAIETLLDIASLVTGVQSFVSNINQGKVGAAVLDGVGIVLDAAAAAAPFIPGGVGAGIKAIRAGEKAAAAVKGADKATDAAKSIEKVVDASKEGSKIVISEGNKVDRSLLNAPNKPGNAPTFKSDGTKVEIHHIDQNPQGPFREMHWSDHRGKGHYKENHPQTNSSNIDRKSFNAQKKEYWKNEYKTNN